MVIAIAAAGALRLGAACARAELHPVQRPEVLLLEGQIEAKGARWLRLDRVRRVGPGLPIPPRILLREAHSEAPSLLRVRSGDWVRARVRLRPWSGERNPGGRDPRRVQRRRGVGAQAWRVETTPLLRFEPRDSTGGRSRSAIDRTFAAFRLRGGQRLREAGPGGGLFAALVYGDAHAVEGHRGAFQALGLSHLLAISGLHLTLVGAAVYRIALAGWLRLPSASWRVPGDPRRVALGLSLGAAGLYALISGSGIPVTRAWWMGAAFALAWGLRRRVSRAAPLHLAAAGLLVFDPAALFDPGAQLSFVACYALVLRRDWVDTNTSSGRFGGARRALGHSADLIAVTTPVAAATLSVVSAWGLLGNAIGVPWTAIVLLPSAFVAALAVWLPTPFGEGLLRLLTPVATLSLDVVAGLAEGLPALPLVVVAPLGIAATLVVAWISMRSRSFGTKVAGAGCIPLLLALWPPGAFSPAPPRAVFFDVGQGDAALVQTRSVSILIDGGLALPGRAGHGARTLVPALRSLAVSRLALVIASHHDRDHRGGLEHVLEVVPVGELWIPWGGRSDPAFASLVAAAGRHAIAVRERGLGSASFSDDTLRVTPLWPPRLWRGSANDRSLALRVEVRDTPGDAPKTLLFTGDLSTRAEAALLASGQPLRAAVLKLAHHGSRTSSSREFLDAVRPAVAVASSARHHRFGMPHDVVCERVRRGGASLWHTGSEGAIWVGLGQRLWVRGHAASTASRACALPVPPP